MTSPSPLLLDTYYHIYNRGNNRQNIFIETRNYEFFMGLYEKYIEPVAETFAYCLLRNHFHFLIRTKTILSQENYYESTRDPEVVKKGIFQPLDPSHQFGRLFNAYAKAVNKTYNFTGSLFQNPFGRIPVTTSAHFTLLITYIHYNPQKHGFVDDFREWPFSSYQALITDKPTRLRREEVRGWFGDLEKTLSDHIPPYEWVGIERFILDD